MENNVDNPSQEQCYTPKFKNDPYFYMPPDIWPEDAVVIDNRPYYLRYRKSEKHIVKAINESNYHVYMDCIDYYKKKHPEIEHPEKTDDFWTNCVCDSIISNAIANRDYIYSGDMPASYENECLKQFDVVFPETIVGYLCHPFVVYDIKYENNYEANIKYDDYAQSILDEMLKDIKKLDRHNRESNKLIDNALADDEWVKKNNEYGKLKIQFIKDGHAGFSVRKMKPTYYSEIRWFEYKDGKKILHKGVY